MDDQCLVEVRALHRFFEEWFAGTLPDTDEAFERVTGVLSQRFELITPDAGRTDRESLLTSLRKKHGSTRDLSPPFSIRIENAAVRPVDEGLRVVTYEEWQQRDGKTTGRLATALFRRRRKALNGVEWLHVHETWLPRRN